MEFLDTIIGVFLGAAAFWTGMHVADRKKLPTSDPHSPTCGCGHHHSMHDPETNECHGATKEHRYHYDREGRWVNGYVPCTCRQYSGPEPLPQYF